VTGPELETAIRAALDRAVPDIAADPYGIYDRYEFLLRWLAHVNPECGAEFVAFIARTAEP
jgi:hypothetical protein